MDSQNWYTLKCYWVYGDERSNNFFTLALFQILSFAKSYARFLTKQFSHLDRLVIYIQFHGKTIYVLDYKNGRFTERDL